MLPRLTILNFFLIALDIPWKDEQGNEYHVSNYKHLRKLSANDALKNAETYAELAMGEQTSLWS